MKRLKDWGKIEAKISKDKPNFGYTQIYPFLYITSLFNIIGLTLIFI